MQSRSGQLLRTGTCELSVGKCDRIWRGNVPQEPPRAAKGEWPLTFPSRTGAEEARACGFPRLSFVGDRPVVNPQTRASAEPHESCSVSIRRARKCEIVAPAGSPSPRK